MFKLAWKIKILVKLSGVKGTNFCGLLQQEIFTHKMWAVLVADRLCGLGVFDKRQKVEKRIKIAITIFVRSMPFVLFIFCF